MRLYVTIPGTGLANAEVDAILGYAFPVVDLLPRMVRVLLTSDVDMWVFLDEVFVDGVALTL